MKMQKRCGALKMFVMPAWMIPNPMPYESVQIYEGKLYVHDSCGRDFLWI